MPPPKRRHPLGGGGELYTPVTPEMLVLFERMRKEYGSWRNVAAVSDTRLKVLRNFRNGSRRAISQRVLDRLISSTGVGSLEEFMWFTAEDLVKLGVWEPVQYVEGDERIKSREAHDE